MMRVAAELDPELRPQAPEPLFQERYMPAYDVTPEGDFVMVTRPHPALERMNVVLNWSAELERLLAGEP